MDPSEPRWRLNSSFSPPPSRRWDPERRYNLHQADGLPCRPNESMNEPILYGSSLGSRSGQFGSDRNHHHSVSDGALSYMGSPADSLPPPRWTPSVQRFDLGEFSTPAGGARPETSSCPRSTERHFTGSNSIGSASPFSESSQWVPSAPASASSSKHQPPIFFPQRSYLGRRSFMSKPVYPLVFRNPVSEAGSASSVIPEPSNAGRTTPSDDSHASPAWPDNLNSPDIKFHKALTELQKMEASPDPNSSFRRDGFRWSNASSYDFGYDGESIDIATDHAGLDSQRYSYPNGVNNSLRYQKCGLCERMLWQKSPWSSTRIVRNGDMPIAGVLPCRHVYHADCLEETTPKGQIHDPPCPLCTRPGNIDGSGSVSFSEPLQVALRSIRRSHSGTTGNAGVGMSGSLIPRERSFRSRLKKQLSLRGKIGKDFFGAGRVFRRVGSSSKNPRDDRGDQLKK
ncbi:RING/U-box superfamily protein [Rhynchospora pubera]|uniref:RING/U-box superfamily protein n=1 Tax=Rhynchospora pubera TaxID=906938 RepID=A0AAV8CG27_9POAL|nr:RING/U-box superfamily protein [Rhynchospora pubera]